MFSVVIPVYNKAPYVVKAVESVLNQTFFNFELIIINDGSTDASLQQLSTINDERVKIIDQTNAGVSVARNNGVQQARFNYIAFLDADDWWNECFLNEMHKLITHYPDAALYGSSYYVVKNGLAKQARIGLDAYFTAGYIDYFGVYVKTFWVPINCSFVVVRKDVFLQEQGFKTGLKFGEDFDLWARIAINNRVGYINKELAFSNQDVDIQNRALNGDKIWSEEEHVIFNISYLENKEKEIPTLKVLLDGLRVRSLSTFYLRGVHKKSVSKNLDLVDWSKQPFFYRFIYHFPLHLVRFYFLVKLIGSTAKSFLLRNRRFRTS